MTLAMKKGGSTALAAGLLILMILFGNALTLPFRVAGFGVNMYIVSMALFAVVLFGLRIKEGRLREKEDRGVMFLYGFTLLWLAAGIVLLLWHRTAVSEGLRQLIQIALGAASAFSLIECLHRGLDKEMIYFWIRIAVLIYIIIAMFEIAGVSEEVAKEALRLATHKLPCKCKVVSRADLEGGDNSEN